MSDKTSDDKARAYFAPPSDGTTPEGEVPVWGEDAEEIARTAGLGSYGAAMDEQEAREETLLGTIERVDNEVRALRALVVVLCAAAVLQGIAVIWLVLRA